MSYEYPEDEEAITSRLAAALNHRGLPAESVQIADGEFVAAVSLPDGRYQYWGVNAGTWGGYEVDEVENEIPKISIITEYPPHDFEQAADFIAGQ